MKEEIDEMEDMEMKKMEEEIDEIDADTSQEKSLQEEIREMNHCLKKQMRCQRLILIVLLAFVAGIAATGYYIGNKAAQYEVTFTQLSDGLKNLDIEEFSQSITTLEEKASQLDVDSMNESIHLLEEKIDDLDVDALNDALDSMKQVADSLTEASESMQTVNNWFKSVFKMEE